jgi:hypothetical protein
VIKGPVDGILSLLVGLLLGIATPGLKDIYRRFISTKVRARIVSTSVVTSFEPTMLVEELDQSPVEEVERYASADYRRYVGYVEIDNVKGHDILEGCEIIIAVCDPIVLTMSRLRRVPDGLVELNPLPHKVTTAEGKASASGARVTAPISVTSRRVCAAFALVANTRFAQSFTVHWRVIADSLPHPRSTFGKQIVRLGSHDLMTAEFMKRAEELSMSQPFEPNS